MSSFNEILQNKISTWIISQINDLPNQGKFRAFNSIRFLKWALKIYNTDKSMAIPACYCALHATEEAVAAFISCAKLYGYDDAKSFNIKNHKQKAIIGFMVTQVSDILMNFSIALSLKPTGDKLSVRYSNDDEICYREATMKLFYLADDEGEPLLDFNSILINKFENIDDLIVEFNKEAHKSRIGISYANSKGYPSGFNEPEDALYRACQLSLGLIWASLDLKKNEGELIPFIKQSLHTAKTVMTMINES